MKFIQRDLLAVHPGHQVFQGRRVGWGAIGEGLGAKVGRAVSCCVV